MKKLLILTIALSMCSLSHAQWWGKGKKGNGNVTTETRNVGDYDQIKCALGSSDDTEEYID